MGIQTRPLVTMIPLLLLAILLGAWAIHEGRRQQLETASALTSQAALLARTLGPGLEAASTAAREIEENTAARVLEITRVLAALGHSGRIDRQAAESLAEQNDLDSLALFDSSGTPRLAIGQPLPREVLAPLQDLFAGRADEIVIGPQLEDGMEHVAAAVRTTAGGAVVIRVHAPSSMAFSGSIGTANLLERLAGTGSVLYIVYTMDPGGQKLEASWDGGEVPAALENGGRRSVRGRDIFEVAVPVGAPAGYRAALRVGMDGEPLGKATASAVRRTAMVGIALSVFSLALVFIALLSRARTVEREESARRLAEAETARRRNERLAAAGALTAGLAHEVRSPLNAIGLAAQRTMRTNGPESDCGRFAAKVRREIGRLEAILREFLELASPVGQSRKETDMARITRGVVDLLADEASAADVRLNSSAGSGTAWVDFESVRRSLINLVRNAIQASPPGGTVELRATAENGWALFEIADDGPGIEEDLEEQLFDAFVTNQAGGVGLGLALVRRVAEEHGGSVTLKNRAQGGALARLRLPLDQAETR